MSLFMVYLNFCDNTQIYIFLSSIEWLSVDHLSIPVP